MNLNGSAIVQYGLRNRIAEQWLVIRKRQIWSRDHWRVVLLYCPELRWAQGLMIRCGERHGTSSPE